MEENIDIKTWFPKPIFEATNILTSQFDYYEANIKQIINDKVGGPRNDLVAVMEFQSATDLQKHPAFSELVDEILLKAKLFLVELGHLQLINTIKIDNMWANITREGDCIFPHVHPNCILSGVYYIKSYPGSKINFFDNITSMHPQPTIRNDLNWDMCGYDCTPGTMLIWKSDFVHGCKKQPTGEKIAISFNLS